MLIIEKSYDLFVDDKGVTYCWSVLKDVFKTSEINDSWIFNEILHKKIFLFNFNDFTINESVLSFVPWRTKRMGGWNYLVWCLREGILSWRRHYTEVLKLMVNRFVILHTGLLTNNETSKTTVRSLLSLYSYIFTYLYL